MTLLLERAEEETLPTEEGTGEDAGAEETPAVVDPAVDPNLPEGQ